MPRGACLSCRLPALPFAFLFAPYPPDPRSQSALPRRGRGRLRLFLCKGLRPLHPRGRTRAALGKGQTTHPAGGASFLLPANPAFSLLFCPPSPEGKDRPPGNGARTCAVGKSARTGVCVAGRTCNNRHPLLTIAAEYGTITHRKIQNAEENGKPCEMCNAGRS